MAASTTKSSPAFTLTMPSDREIVMTRLFDAPRHLVFEAWTKPEHVAHWWGWRGSTLPVNEIDLRVGGAWRRILRTPDGNEHAFKGVFREIAMPERLVYTECSDDPSVGSPEWVTTVTFEEHDGKTKLTSMLLHKSKEARDGHLKAGMEAGAAHSLDRLAEHLDTQEREIVITRVFDAPREIVFKAWTDPERLKRWWGPKHFTNPVCEVDARPGGAIRIHMRGPDGTVYPMTGVYHEIVEPERLIFTASALDAKGDPLFEQLTTVTFEEHSGKTKLTLHASFSNIRLEAARHLAGAEVGWNMSLDRLAEEAGSASA